MSFATLPQLEADPIAVGVLVAAVALLALGHLGREAWDAARRWRGGR